MAFWSALIACVVINRICWGMIWMLSRAFPLFRHGFSWVESVGSTVHRYLRWILRHLLCLPDLSEVSPQSPIWHSPRVTWMKWGLVITAPLGITAGLLASFYAHWEIMEGSMKLVVLIFGLALILTCVPPGFMLRSVWQCWSARP